MSHSDRHAKEHCHILLPGVLFDRGFEDASWHNDVCAHVMRGLPDDGRLEVWVAEDDPAEREMGAASEKYCVAFYQAGNESSEADEYFESDDLNVIVEHLDTKYPWRNK